MKKKKKRKLKKFPKLIILSLIILIIAIIVYLTIFNNKDLKLINNLNIELNSEIKISNLIKSSRGEIVNPDEKIDTSTIGKKKITIYYKINNQEKEYHVSINIVDNEKPQIESDNLVININSNINIKDLIKVSDNSQEEIKIDITGNYDLNKEGEYSLNVKATDKSGNSTSKKITLKVLGTVSYNEDGSLKDGTYGTSKGYTIEVRNGLATIDGILIANKTYPLPSTYKPQNPYTKINYEYCTDCIEKHVMEAFLELKEAASKEGLKLRINSGYRSYETQVWLYQSYVDRDGKEEADIYSSRAGSSEHQTGLCFDLNSTDDTFTNTKEGIWVNANAWKYGFIIRFPKGKEKYTGYEYESWHLRYVGKELAEKLYNNGDWISLEEYFGITSKYPN